MTIDVPRLQRDAARLSFTAPQLRFAFYGRVSTEDNQDPEASRNWQLTRANALIEPRNGLIVVQFFDIGQSRSLPWKRRPQAAALLAALADPNRGFDAVIIGEPQRAFYGNQYGLTMPVFTHYGVQLWVPEVGGPIDPDSEAHDLIMSVFGGMSKGERSRVKIRVRTAMQAQAKIEGRFLGGRPPYGYRLADAGPHPNPGKAADGKRLHRLEPDPATAPVVQRIFALYLRGLGIFTIAEGLNRDGIPSPSAADPARNRHRSGAGWAKSAIKAILANPRYTGRQVWNKQRKDEVLLDVHDVGLGYQTRMRWNHPDAWVWSESVVHEPLVSVEDFEAAQGVAAQHGRGRKTRERHYVKRTYILRGMLLCGLCGRRMQGQYSHDAAYYRCRYPNEYALVSHTEHPRNVYLAENDVLPVLDNWLLRAFAPHRLADTVAKLHAAQPEQPAAAPTPEDGLQKIIDACDDKLAQYRAIADAGGDPATVAAWTAEVAAQRTAALAQQSTRRAESRKITKLSPQDIERLIGTFDDVRRTIRDAEPADKREVYRQIRLTLTYHPGQNKIRAEACPGPDSRGVMVCVRGGT
ncbi:MAG TPA: recombinase family protein [Rugosimonospora sp.]|nr:recombinase family protein [Rugosimonospora sp.]